MKKVAVLILLLSSMLYSQESLLTSFLEISTQTINFDAEDRIKFEIEPTSTPFYKPSSVTILSVYPTVVTSSEIIIGNTTQDNYGFQVYPKADQWEPFWHALNKITIFLETHDENQPTYPWTPLIYFYIDYRDCRFRTGPLTNDITIRYDFTKQNKIFYAPGLLEGGMFDASADSITTGGLLKYWEVVGYSGHVMECFFSEIEFNVSNVNNRPYLEWDYQYAVSEAYTGDIYRRLSPQSWVNIAPDYNMSLNSYTDSDLIISTNPDLIAYYKIIFSVDEFYTTTTGQILYSCLYKANSNSKSGEIKSNTLLNAYPNPFNPVTTIKYELPEDGFVQLLIYDLLGNKIKTLVNSRHNAGRFQVLFDGSALPSGVYFYRLFTDRFSATRKLLLMK